MSIKRYNFQFRLNEDIEEIIINEARRRNVSPSEHAKSLVISSIRDNNSLIARSDMLLRLSATNAYQVSNFIVEVMKKLNPELNESEIIEFVNNSIFTNAKNKTEALLQSLGVDR